MKRILVIQTAFLGDVVLTTPLIRALHRGHRGSRLTVLTTPQGREILTGLPYVDTVLVYDKKAGLYGLGGLVRAVGDLRRGRFDLAVAAQRSFRTGFLIRMTGAGERIGFEAAAGSWAYTRTVPLAGDKHAARRYLDLAAAAGGEVEDADPRPELAVLPASRRAVEARLEAHGVGPGVPLVCIAPGSVWGTKRWLPEGYAEVARRAAGRGHRVVLVGSPSEHGLCERVRDLAGGSPIVMAGDLSVSELTAVIDRARVLICNDSGPAHVATAVGTAVVAIFGPTVPAMGYAPIGSNVRVVEHGDLSCRPCDRHGPQTCPLGHFRCMREITPDDVLRAVDAVSAAPPVAAVGSVSLPPD